jgi:hypothetical protein
MSWRDQVNFQEHADEIHFVLDQHEMGTAINQSDMIKYRNEIKLICDLCIYKLTYYFFLLFL